MAMSRASYITIPTGKYLDDEQSDRDNEIGDDGKKLALATPMEPLQINSGVDGLMESRENIFLSFGYMLAMGVCGIVLVALGSSLESLAENINTTSTEIGTIFIARGVGAVMGAMVSAKLYKWFTGNRVMFARLVFVFYHTAPNAICQIIYCHALIFLFSWARNSFHRYWLSNYDKKNTWEIGRTMARSEYSVFRNIWCICPNNRTIYEIINHSILFYVWNRVPNGFIDWFWPKP